MISRKKPLKRSAIGKPKKTKKRTLRNKCDRLVSIRCRSIGECEFCRGRRHLQWCHFITRGVIHLRYDPRNYACLDASCHFTSHDNPAWFVDQWKKLRGEKVVEDLKREANEVKPITEDFYLNILKEVQNGNQD